MRLTLYTDFALRTLIQVGLNDGKLTTINDIAQSFGISKQHLMKVVSHLSKKAYLETMRGRNGGIRLMRETDPDDPDPQTQVRCLPELQPRG